jgi:sulfatase maturation enzyme AslB (radical SAM superfamily)
VSVNATFKSYQHQVHQGVKRCRELCTYFEGCQGGNPAHKFYEFGSFDVTAHTSCMLNDQLVQTLMTRKLAPAN